MWTNQLISNCDCIFFTLFTVLKSTTNIEKDASNTSIVCYRLVCGSKHGSAEVLKSKLYLLYVFDKQGVHVCAFNSASLSLVHARIFAWYFYIFGLSLLLSLYVCVRVCCVCMCECLLWSACSLLLFFFSRLSFVRCFCVCLYLCIGCLFIRVLLWTHIHHITDHWFTFVYSLRRCLYVFYLLATFVWFSLLPFPLGWRKQKNNTHHCRRLPSNNTGNNKAWIAALHSLIFRYIVYCVPCAHKQTITHTLPLGTTEYFFPIYTGRLRFDFMRMRRSHCDCIGKKWLASDWLAWLSPIHRRTPYAFACGSYGLHSLTDISVYIVGYTNRLKFCLHVYISSLQQNRNFVYIFKMIHTLTTHWQ